MHINTYAFDQQENDTHQHSTAESKDTSNKEERFHGSQEELLGSNRKRFLMCKSQWIRMSPKCPNINVNAVDSKIASYLYGRCMRDFSVQGVTSKQQINAIFIYIIDMQLANQQKCLKNVFSIQQVFSKLDFTQQLGNREMIHTVVSFLLYIIVNIH